MNRYMLGMRWAAALIVLNSAVAILLSSFVDEGTSDWVFLAGRMAITIFAGWFVIRRALGGFWAAALSGPLLMFIDHVLLKGGYYLYAHFFAQDSLLFSGWQSFFGVLTSYIMFFWIPMTVALFGAIVARLQRRISSPNSSLQPERPLI